MFRQAITIYNRYENTDTRMDKYHRTVIDNAHFEATQGVQLGDMNINTDNSFRAVIPLVTGDYVKPSDYVGVGWTLAEGDYVVKGALDIEIDDFDDLKGIDQKFVIDGYQINDYARVKKLNNYTVVGR